jgi:hypothetical protein
MLTVAAHLPGMRLGTVGAFVSLGVPTPWKEANARLIAAAPKLLEALEKAERALTALLPATREGTDKKMRALLDVRDEARVAIAKTES